MKYFAAITDILNFLAGERAPVGLGVSIDEGRQLHKRLRLTETPLEFSTAFGGATFVLSGRADRVKRYADGTFEIMEAKAARNPPDDARIAHDMRQLRLYGFLAAMNDLGFEGVLKLAYYTPGGRLLKTVEQAYEHQAAYDLMMRGLELFSAAVDLVSPQAQAPVTSDMLMVPRNCRDPKAGYALGHFMEGGLTTRRDMAAQLHWRRYKLDERLMALGIGLKPKGRFVKPYAINEAYQRGHGMKPVEPLLPIDFSDVTPLVPVTKGSRTAHDRPCMHGEILEVAQSLVARWHRITPTIANLPKVEHQLRRAVNQGQTLEEIKQAADNYLWRQGSKRSGVMELDKDFLEMGGWRKHADEPEEYRYKAWARRSRATVRRLERTQYRRPLNETEQAEYLMHLDLTSPEQHRAKHQEMKRKQADCSLEGDLSSIRSRAIEMVEAQGYEELVGLVQSCENASEVHDILRGLCAA